MKSIFCFLGLSLSFGGFFLKVPSAHSALHVTELKGMSQFIQLSQKCSHLNPISGFLMSKTPLLVNIYNYPDLSDPKEVFIQSLFNAPAGSDNPSYFQVSPLARKFGKFLGPSTVGAILRNLPSQVATQIKEAILADPEFKERTEKARLVMERLQDEIDRIEASIVGPVQSRIVRIQKEIEGLSLEKNELQKKRRGLHRFVNHSLSADPLQAEILISEIASLGEKTQDLASQIEVLEEEKRKLKRMISRTRLSGEPRIRAFEKKKSEEEYKETYLDAFVDRILEANVAPQAPHALYPEHFVEQTLVALAWMNTEDHNKNQFLELYRQLSDDCFSEGYDRTALDPGAKWIQEKFTYADYLFIAKKEARREGTEVGLYLLDHPDEAAFFSKSHRIFDPESQGELGALLVQYTYPNGFKTTFSDCMEVSLLNFFTLTLMRLDDRELKERFKNIKTEFAAFLEANRDLSLLDTLKVREEWTALLTNLPQVEYRELYRNYFGHDMQPSVDNIFKVVEDLLLGPGALSPELKAASRETLMNTLCELLSSNDFRLDWELEEGTPEDLDRNRSKTVLIFRINGVPALVWGLSPDHSEVMFERIRSNDWRSIVVHQMAKVLAERDRGNLKSLEAQVLLANATREDFVPIISNLGLLADPQAQTFLRFSWKLSNIETKYLFSNSLLEISPASTPRVARILKTLPEEEPASFVQKLNLMYSYPTLKRELFEDAEGMEQRFREDPATFRDLSIQFCLLPLFKESLKVDPNAFLHFKKNLFKLIKVGLGSYVKALLEAFPDLANEVNENQENLLHHYALNRNALHFMYFAKQFPHLLKQQDLQGNTPAHHLAKRNGTHSQILRKTTGGTKILQFLLDRFPEVLQIENSAGESPLQSFVKAGESELIRIFNERRIEGSP